MPRLLVFALLLLFGLVTVDSTDADACRCVGKKPAAYVKGAERVILAKVIAESKTGAPFLVDFEVLATLKGASTKTFRWTRSEKNPLCGPGFKVGEVSLLFVTDNNLELCTGNYGMGAQAAAFPEYLDVTGQQTSLPSVSDMEALLGTALKGYMHKRKKILASFPPLKGSTAKVGATSFPIVGASKKRAKRSVQVTAALRFGDILYLNGNYPVEGLWFRVLLRDLGKGGYEVLHHTSIES